MDRRSAAITSHDGDRRLTRKPGSRRRQLAAGQQGDGPASLQIADAASTTKARFRPIAKGQLHLRIIALGILDDEASGTKAEGRSWRMTLRSLRMSNASDHPASQKVRWSPYSTLFPDPGLRA